MLLAFSGSACRPWSSRCCADRRFVHPRRRRQPPVLPLRQRPLLSRPAEVCRQPAWLLAGSAAPPSKRRFERPPGAAWSAGRSLPWSPTLFAGQRECLPDTRSHSDNANYRKQELPHDFTSTVVQSSGLLAGPMHSSNAPAYSRPSTGTRTSLKLGSPASDKSMTSSASPSNRSIRRRLTARSSVPFCSGEPGRPPPAALLSVRRHPTPSGEERRDPHVQRRARQESLALLPTRLD